MVSDPVHGPLAPSQIQAGTSNGSQDIDVVETWELVNRGPLVFAPIGQVLQSARPEHAGMAGADCASVERYRLAAVLTAMKDHGRTKYEMSVSGPVIIRCHRRGVLVPGGSNGHFPTDWTEGWDLSLVFPS